MIRYKPGKVDPVWLVTQIARAWPEKKLAVVTTKTAEMLGVAQQFRKYGLDDATYAGRRHYTNEFGRVLVATDDFLSGHVEVQKRDIAVFLDATEAFSRRGFDAIQFSLQARRVPPSRQMQMMCSRLITSSLMYIVP